ncbi:MAG: 23S rRNA (guanosine(2251)-2'-O)-methyltransferase RlmB [Bacteroidota bacterium]
MRDNFDNKNNSHNENLIYGTRAVLEALRSGKEIEKLFVQSNLNNPLIKELKTELKSRAVHFQLVPIEKLNRLTRNNHQGVVGYVAEISYYSIEDVVPQLFERGKNPVIIILDRITDTRNMGAIARTAECMGASAIVIPSRGSAIINADTVKTSAGALHYIPICREDNLKIVIDYLKESGIAIVACSEKTNNTIYQTDYTKPVAIILGSEENGISGEYMKRADAIVKIPMSGKIESLNVSVAAGMILSEVVRQRSK